MSSGPGIPGFGPGDLPPGLDPEAVRRLAEQMERMPVGQVLQETIQLLGTLAEARITGQHQDLAQARLAIDALKALAPVLSPTLDPAVDRALATSIANLQLLYVRGGA